MQTKLANDSSPERYVVEIDGITKSEYSVFVKALTASLQLKQEFPQSSVKLRDADEKAPRMPIDVTHRRPRLRDKTDRLPYTKARRTAQCAPQLDRN